MMITMISDRNQDQTQEIKPGLSQKGKVNSVWIIYITAQSHKLTTKLLKTKTRRAIPTVTEALQTWEKKEKGKKEEEERVQD
ncbi:hypothetical protein OIU79_025731 [Salix purpurea]|uniref:Uncharacterized protein n=1 Tax=Salix purpurea TaxID=77065 RepID=A0A9Q0W851_SALPP|nr:hypothetical protein OIU79_025731 [Salix purpurea]